METFESLFRSARWVPIANCPGRFVLGESPSAVPPLDIARDGDSQLHHVPGARDPVIVVRLSDGSGLISYAKSGGLYLHTLNSAQGMARKLAALGIVG